MGLNNPVDEHSAHTPLLALGNHNHNHVSTRGCWAKLVLKMVMWAIFIPWVSLIFLFPAESVNALFERWNHALSGTVFGLTGSIFLVFSGPILLIAFLAIAHFAISGEEDEEEILGVKKKSPSFRLWTFPVLVDGTFGVVSAAELIGIVLFAAYIVWSVYAYTIRNLTLLSQYHLTFKEESLLMLELLGLRFGMIGLFCLAFLFLPVARGSVLLRLIDIPFEHAAKYHVWLGHLTMLLFTLHGLLYVIPWTVQGTLLTEILEWKDVGIANLAGVISLIAGLFMWVTSLPLVRKLYFELFFYTHQLYVVFVIFLALHVGDFIFSIAAGGIFLFMLDRFLRFCQSRKTVDIISASCLPCGTVELVLSKPANLRYNALSFIFLQVRELSLLQWHPFSVSSSPLDGKYHISVLIKVLGEWTSKLRGNISHISETEPQKGLSSISHDKITAYVEGPYGHEFPYHLQYDNLILVAGGIGISPFLAILTDILHRIRDGKPCLTRNVLVVWAVKGSNEIPLLSIIDTQSICPSFSDKLNLDIHIYVTRESEAPLEEGKVDKAVSSCVYPAGNGRGMSVLVGTGNNAWSGIYVIASTVGFVILMGLVDKFYIYRYSISAWWYKGLLFIACMVASIMIFGGLVIGLWHLWEKKVVAREELEENKEAVDNDSEPVRNQDSYQGSLASSAITRYGSRPDFKEIFGRVSKNWGTVDVGVIVCGPASLETSVAKECRSISFRRQSHDPVFHFNSHSFDL